MLNSFKFSASSAVLLLLFLPAVEAKLALVTLEEFRRWAPCGRIGDVVVVEEAKASGDLPGLNEVVALVVFSSSFGAPEDCSQLARARVRFSTEYHSSQPRKGDRVVLFLRPLGVDYAEAIYGRSYWRLSAEGHIEVDWRNSFLILGFRATCPENLDAPPHVSLQEVSANWATWDFEDPGTSCHEELEKDRTQLLRLLAGDPEAR